MSSKRLKLIMGNAKVLAKHFTGTLAIEFIECSARGIGFVARYSLPMGLKTFSSVLSYLAKILDRLAESDLLDDKAILKMTALHRLTLWEMVISVSIAI